MNAIISIVTIFVTFVLGFISKKFSLIDSKLIPIQNLLVGILSSVIYYFITRDIDVVLVLLGLGTGGTYDIFHNLNKLIRGEQ